MNVKRQAQFGGFLLSLINDCPVAKMYAVDIWILDAYDKSTTTLVMGALLMLVSFVYQRNRAGLEGPDRARSSFQSSNSSEALRNMEGAMA